MDEDLEQMTREELVAEADMSFVGITLRFGACCLKKPIRFPPCRPGRNLFAAACAIGNLSTNKRRTHPGQRNSNERCDE
jgi:hypothetical protein